MSEDYEYRIWQAERKIKEQMEKNEMAWVSGEMTVGESQERNKELKRILNDLGRY